MNVKQLKAIIETLPDEMEIIIKKDSEGNEYSPLIGVDTNSVYVKENHWHGNVYSLDLSKDDYVFMTNEEWEGIKSMPRSLILAPVN